jgi:hypothetical protein
MLGICNIVVFLLDVFSRLQKLSHLVTIKDLLLLLGQSLGSSQSPLIPRLFVRTLVLIRLQGMGLNVHRVMFECWLHFAVLAEQITAVVVEVLQELFIIACHLLEIEHTHPTILSSQNYYD